MARRRRRHRVRHHVRRAAHRARRFLTINRPRRRAHRRRRAYASNPRRHRRRRHNPFMRRHRRRYHRNPSFSVRGIMAQVQTGLVGGLHVMVGRVGSRALPDLTGVSTMIASGSLSSVPATAALAAAQIVSGMLVAFAGARVFGAGAGGYVLAGAFDAVIEDLLQGLSLPVIGQYLGDGGSMVTPYARAAFAGYSLNANVASGSTLGPGNVNRATGSAIARPLRGYSTPIGKGMVRRSGLGGGMGAAPAGYHY